MVWAKSRGDPANLSRHVGSCRVTAGSLKVGRRIAVSRGAGRYLATSRAGSGDQAVDDVAVYVGEAEVAALELVDQLLVVDAQQAEHGGVEVMDVDGVFDDVVAVVVGLAVDQARFDPAAGGPEGEAAAVMVAAIVGGGEGAL